MYYTEHPSGIQGVASGRRILEPQHLLAAMIDFVDSLVMR